MSLVQAHNELPCAAHALFNVLAKHAVHLGICVLLFAVISPVRAEQQPQRSQLQQKLYEDFVEPLLSDLRSFSVDEDVLSLVVNSLPNATFRPTTYSTIPGEKGSCAVTSRYQDHAFSYVLNADKSLRWFTHIADGYIVEIIRQERVTRYRTAYIHILADVDSNGRRSGYRSYPDERSIECSISVDGMAVFRIAFADVISVFRIEFPFGIQKGIDWHSESEARAYYRRAWVELYINPVGWYAALIKGIRPNTLYKLKNDRSWKIALHVGQVLIILLVVAAPFIAVQVARRARKASGQQSVSGDA
jgi:hypothetical protein